MGEIIFYQDETDAKTRKQKNLTVLLGSLKSENKRSQTQYVWKKITKVNTVGVDN